MDVKFIANFELIDIGKKLCAWKSTVCCKNTVGTLPSDRKLCAVQMSDAGLQILVTGAMVNGKLDVDLRNGKVSHYSVICNVQDLPVFGIFDVIFIFTKYISVEVVLLNGIIESFCLFPLRGEVLRFHVLYCIVIAADQLILSVGVPLV